MNISLHSFSDALILFITGLKKKKKRANGVKKAEGVFLLFETSAYLWSYFKQQF